MVYLTQQTGVYTTSRSARASSRRASRCVWCSAWPCTTAVLSAFLDNLTTVLLVVPITFLLADALDIDPIPLVIIEMIASNIGGTATLIGDPPNILIAGATGLTFNAFIVNLAPIVDRHVRRRDRRCSTSYFRTQLQIAPEDRARVMELDAAASIEDAGELRRTVPILIGTILAFFVHQPLARRAGDRRADRAPRSACSSRRIAARAGARRRSSGRRCSSSSACS